MTSNYNQMINQSLKIYLLNTVSMVISFSNIESALKLILLTFSIIYTAIQIFKLLKKDQNDKNK